jgi:hypothetical protein
MPEKLPSTLVLLDESLELSLGGWEKPMFRNSILVLLKKPPSSETARQNPSHFWFPILRLSPTFASQLRLFVHISVQSLFPENRAQINRILVNLHPFHSNSAHIPFLCRTTHTKNV